MDGKGWIYQKCSEKVPKNILPNDGLTDDLPWDRIRKKKKQTTNPSQMGKQGANGIH